MKDIIQAFKSENASLAIMLPTPPTAPLPNPFASFPTGIKIQFGGDAAIPVTLFFGRELWYGRFIGLGVMRSAKDKDPVTIFHMDYVVHHEDSEPTDDYDHWVTNDGNYEFQIPR